MRLLVVEDEVKMAGSPQARARGGGLRGRRHRSGEEALWLGTENPYDAIVLDLMLPDVTASRCAEAPRARRWTPVLMLTARDAVRDRVAGLDAGADDYLTKPFSLAELLARADPPRRDRTALGPPRRRSQPRPGGPHRARRPGDRAHRQGVRAARVLHATSRRGPHPHAADRARVGLRVRGRLQRRRRLRPVPTEQGRPPVRARLDRDRARVRYRLRSEPAA